MAKRKESRNGSGDIGFEDQLWNAACILWGNMAPSAYQNIILGLVFLKYVSDCFNYRYQELVDEGQGFEEDMDEYTTESISMFPPKAPLELYLQFASKPEIGKSLNEAMVEIEKAYPTQLKGVLPKNYSKPDWDKVKLGQVILEFSNILMSSDDHDRDILGRTYEYFLTKFSKQAGKGGEFFTPPCIVRILVNVIQPFHGKVYDPCCGSGGMFVQSAKFITEHSGNVLRDVSVYGQDANPDTWRLCKMNLAIRGISADLGTAAVDTFGKDQHPLLKADFILANPPFNLSKWGADALAADPRWKYGVPSDSNANYAWIQHMLSHLSGTGRIGLVLANGSLGSNTNNEGVIRKNLILDDKVEGIIALPPQLFYTVQIPVCLWFFTKDKKQPGKTLFIDARKLGDMVSRTQKEIPEEDIKLIAKMFDDFRGGNDVDLQGFAKVATIDDMAAQDYILTPGRYVGSEEQEGDDEPFEEKMKKLAFDLSNLL